jgi:hypothetical protein
MLQRLLDDLNAAYFRMKFPEGTYEQFSPTAKKVFGFDDGHWRLSATARHGVPISHVLKNPENPPHTRLTFSLSQTWEREERAHRNKGVDIALVLALHLALAPEIATGGGQLR